MLIEIKEYMVECDGCKKTYSDQDVEPVFLDPCDAAEEILSKGWSIDGDKCYCPNCKNKHS